LRYDRYVATSDQATFQHPADVYREYEAEEENTPIGALQTSFVVPWHCR